MTVDAGLTDYDRRLKREFLREFLPAIIGYSVLLVVVVTVIDFETAGRWKYLIALAPVVPSLWGVRAVARSIGRLDELQRDIRLSAMSMGFGVAMIIAMTLGFLGMAGLETSKWAPWAIYAGGQLTWAASTSLLTNQRT